MKGFPKFLGLVLAISLSLSVIWPVPASDAAISPVDFLEQIKDGLGAPGALDLDSSGNLYVADVSAGVKKFNAYGTLVAGYDAVGPTGTGLAVNPVNGRVYVSAADRVIVLDGNLVEVGLLGAGAGEFGSAGAIDVDAATGKVYVADAQARLVKVYAAAGSLDAEFSAFVTGCDAMAGLTVDEATGEVYVSYRQGALQAAVFDLAGNYKRSILAETGFGSTAMYSLSSLEVASGSNLGFFADYVGNRVSILDLSTVQVQADVLNASGELIGPSDIAFDAATSRLFVATAGGVSVYGLGSGYTLPVNHAPSAPVLLSPLSGSEVSAAPVLSFQPSVDPDGDSVSYVVDVAGVGVFSGLSAAEFSVPGELQEDSCYSWKVQATDGSLQSAWSETAEFCMNATNAAPSAPVLQSPVGGESVRPAGVLSWSAATDSDPNDTIAYTVEIAADASFASAVVADEVADSASALLALNGYSALVPGANYFWRVTAVDSKGAQSVSANVGSFVFDDVRLMVTANMPGAQVFLDGSQAYSGQYVGVAPVALDSLNEGSYSVVVERAGFETFTAQVELAAGSTTEVTAVMTPALEPVNHTYRKGGLAYYGSRRLVEVNYGSERVAPVMADLNSDGILDLLVMGQAGWLHLYQGESIGDKCVFDGSSVLLPVSAVGDTPFVADWNDDGLQDLLVGAQGGTVSLLLNVGTATAPRFNLSQAVYLQADNGPVAVAADAVPVVADLNGDHAKDLLVGSADGKVVVFYNTGSDAAPALAAGQVVVATAGAVAPAVTDWDADGQKDIVLAQDGKLLLARNNGAGFDVPVQIASGLSNGLRVCVLDVDKEQGKDIVVGDSLGRVSYLESRGVEALPTFGAALVDKVDQIAELTVAAGQNVTAQVGALRSTLQQGDMALALVQTEVLLGDLAAGSVEAEAVGELALLLQ